MKTKPMPDLCQYDEAECAPKPRKSKDKRHWCKGKVGVKHKVKWKKEEYRWGIFWQSLLCIVCGKQLDWFSGVWRKKDETDAQLKVRTEQAWVDKQADVKKRLAYYLEFVD